MDRLVSRIGLCELVDTRKGWCIDLIQNDKKYMLRITEGWERFMGEKSSRKLLLSGAPMLIDYVSCLLWFLPKDTKWRNTFNCWHSLRIILDFILQYLFKEFKIISIKRK